MIRSYGMPVEPPGVYGPCWVICRGDAFDDLQKGLLTVKLPGWGTVLPIFGSKEDALGFLKGRPESGSRPPLEALQTARAQLASALLDTLAGVDRVVFDPLPGPDLQDTVRLASLCRGAFVDLILGRGRAWSTRGDHEGMPWTRRGAEQP